LPDLRCSCCNTVRFCCDIEACYLLADTMTELPHATHNVYLVQIPIILFCIYLTCGNSETNLNLHQKLKLTAVKLRRCQVTVQHQTQLIAQGLYSVTVKASALISYCSSSSKQKDIDRIHSSRGFPYGTKSHTTRMEMK
jgi:hypothetical protein